MLILGGGLVQWVGLCTHIAGGPGLIPGQGTRSHTPKIRPGTDKKTNKKNSSANRCALKMIPVLVRTNKIHFNRWENLCRWKRHIWRRLLSVHLTESQPLSLDWQCGPESPCQAASQLSAATRSQASEWCMSAKNNGNKSYHNIVRFCVKLTLS